MWREPVGCILCYAVHLVRIFYSFFRRMVISWLRGLVMHMHENLKCLPMYRGARVLIAREVQGSRSCTVEPGYMMCTLTRRQHDCLLSTLSSVSPTCVSVSGFSTTLTYSRQYPWLKRYTDSLATKTAHTRST